MITVRLTKLEAEMLRDAADRMEADDVWDRYTTKQSEALASGAMKLAQAQRKTTRGREPCVTTTPNPESKN